VILKRGVFSVTYTLILLVSVNMCAEKAEQAAGLKAQTAAGLQEGNHPNCHHLHDCVSLLLVHKSMAAICHRTTRHPSRPATNQTAAVAPNSLLS